MHIFSTKVSDLRFENRLVPAFYYYSQEIKKQNMEDGISYITLGDYATISDGEHSAIPRNSNGGIRYLYGRNIKEGVIDFDPISDESYIDKDDYEKIKRCHINQNDVLIAIYGTVGKSAVYKKEYVGVAGIPRHISNITINRGAPLTPEYLTIFFRSKYGKWQMYSLMTGNIQQLLSLKNLREFDVPLVSNELMKQLTAKEKIALEYEIEAQMLINEARKELYNYLGFDVEGIKRDFTFSVESYKLFESNVWSPSFYDCLYVNMENALKKKCKIAYIKDICELIHGDEVGSDSYKSFIERDINKDKPFVRTSDIVNYETDLYPDYYISPELCCNQDVKPGDVLFTKDGKIGCTALVTNEDRMMISSGIERLRLNNNGVNMGLTQEYLFIVLSTPEIGRYGAIRRTVVASTIPHLREERLRDIVIPIIADGAITKITELVKKAFSLKAKRKQLITEIDLIMEKEFQC